MSEKAGRGRYGKRRSRAVQNNPLLGAKQTEPMVRSLAQPMVRPRTEPMVRPRNELMVRKCFLHFDLRPNIVTAMGLRPKYSYYHWIWAKMR